MTENHEEGAEMKAARRTLSFDISPNDSKYEFYVYKKIQGTWVSFDFGGLGRKMLPLMKTHSLTLGLSWTIREVLRWAKRLGINRDGLSVQFVFPQLRAGLNGRGVAGKHGRSLLQFESDIIHGNLALYMCDEYCEDIIPHELMHILDVQQGRSPSIYPFVAPGGGEWIDLFRHLWIDGFLEARGMPYSAKKLRVEELSRAGVKNPEGIASAWWGTPMSMRDAIRVGLDAGLQMDSACPVARWYYNNESRNLRKG